MNYGKVRDGDIVRFHDASWREMSGRCTLWTPGHMIVKVSGTGRQYVVTPDRFISNRPAVIGLDNITRRAA